MWVRCTSVRRCQLCTAYRSLSTGRPPRENSGSPWSPGPLDALRLQLQQEYEDTLVNPYIAAERGYVDAVIPPSHTRGYIGTALRLLERKIAQVPPKKHGNIPL